MMRKKIRITVLFAAIGFLLSACQFDSTRFYFYHPNILTYVLQSCEGGSYPVTARCQRAYEAASQLRELSQQLMAGQQDYGQKIMSLENQIANLQVQLAKAKDVKTKTALVQQLHKAEEHKRKMLFVIGLYVRL